MLIKRKYDIWLPVLAFLSLLIGGLIIAVISLKDIQNAEWQALRDPEKILSGESTRRFTKLLNQRFVLGATFSQIERGIQWNLTGDWGTRVREGCDGWLFLTDELELHRDRNSAADFRTRLAVQLDHRLKSRGIKLIMVVVPDKTRIENTHLCGLHRSSLIADRVSSWSGALSAQGVEVLDLTASLKQTKGDSYYRTDTHWNESGANAAAFSLASRLSQLNLATVSAGAVRLADQLIERPGDLVHLAGLDKLPALLRPSVELATQTDVAPLAVSSDDLFGDAGLPSIVLVGTSYSRNSNFVPFLEHHLGESVANLAKDGGDFSGAATEFFVSTEFRESPPKLVIWEVPERVIEMPIKDEERKWFDSLSTTEL